MCDLLNMYAVKTIGSTIGMQFWVLPFQKIRTKKQLN